METFHKLFGSLLTFVYHCFDRIVIQGYLPLLIREEHIVHFFRDILGLYPITKEVLSRRTSEYKHWVEAFARNHNIPMEWAQKGVRKEDYVRPHLERMQRRNRYGVYFILQSMEQGFSFQSLNPKYVCEDPNYRPKTTYATKSATYNQLRVNCSPVDWRNRPTRRAQPPALPRLVVPPPPRRPQSAPN